MSSVENPSEHVPPRPLPLRVFRVAPGKAAKVAVLSKGIAGLFVHWTRARSVVCTGEACPAVVHKTGRLWKGYLSALVWEHDAGHWQPVVFEVTEHVELDMRGIVARGQLWEVFREVASGKRHCPTRARLMEQRSPADFPMSYDCLPTLQHLYHAEDLDTSHANPLPARTLVCPVIMPAPAIAEKPSENGNRATRAEIADAINKLRKSTQLPL